MNLFSLSLVTFLLTDQLLTIATPFSSGFGLILFIITLVVIIIPRILEKNNKISYLLTLISPSEYAGMLLICTYSLIAAINAPCNNRLLFSLSSTLLVITTWITLKIFTRTIKEKHAIEPIHALAGLIIIYLFLCSASLGFDLYSFLQHAKTNRPSGLYLEPSHLFLYSAPLMLTTISHPQTRILGVLLTTVIYVLAYSATYMVFSGLIMATYTLYYLSNRQKSKNHKTIFMIIAAIMLFVITAHGTYLKDRLETSTETRNFSTLVYLNGWLLAKSTSDATHGFGLGIGNMGCSETINNDNQTLSAAIKSASNTSHVICSRDGSFLASKIISELGILGIMLLSALIIRLLWILKKMLNEDFNLYLSGAISLIAILLFIRGLPYFSAPVIYSLITLINPKIANQRNLTS